MRFRPSTYARRETCTHHVERLKHLALVGRTVTVHGERRVLFTMVLLREGKTSTKRHLRADDTVASLESLGEDVHRATLALGDTAYAAEKFADKTLNITTTEDNEGMGAVRGDDVVVKGRRRVKADRDCFLHARATSQRTSFYVPSYLSVCNAPDQ